jgi:hypothetical protein
MNETDTTTSIALDLGVAAYDCNEARSSNPFEKHSAERRAWFKGYTESWRSDSSFNSAPGLG